MYKLILILGLLILSCLFISGCNDKDVTSPFQPIITEIDSTRADWIVGFYVEGSDHQFSVWVTSTGMEQPDLQSDMHLIINGNDHQLYIAPLKYQIPWHTTLNLIPGILYDVRFVINGVEKCHTSIAMPLEGICNYPETYNPSEPYNLIWELPQDNQYQLLEIDAMRPNPSNPDSAFYAQKFIKLKSSVRSYTIPAYSIAGFEDGSYYDIYLQNVNYVSSNRISFYACNGFENDRHKKDDISYAYQKQKAIYKMIENK